MGSEMCIRDRQITKPKRAYWRWHRKNIDDSIVTRQFCNCTKEALPATLVDATGTVWLSLSVRSECREMQISGAHYLACAVALLLSTRKQNEQRSETVFELVEKKNGRHRVEKK